MKRSVIWTCLQTIPIVRCTSCSASIGVGMSSLITRADITRWWTMRYARWMACFGKNTWNHLICVLGGNSGTFGRIIAPPPIFSAHAMTHTVSVHSEEMIFAIIVQKKERLAE
jgi:hypothetical protein